jgi:hypothetical protein
MLLSAVLMSNVAAWHVICLTPRLLPLHKVQDALR